MSGSASANPSGLVNLAGLVSTLAPLFLGSGKQTSSTTTAPGRQVGVSGTTTSSSPDVLAALTNNVNQATANSTDSSKTDALVANIMHESALAFAPTLASGNSAGLYSTSTLSLLSGEAQARATAASSQAVLNYQTGQQQIAQQGLQTIANNNKTTSSSSDTTTLPGAASTVTMKAPAIDPVTSLLTLGGGVIANKLFSTGGYGSKALDSLGSSASDLLSSFSGSPAASTLTNFANTTGVAGATPDLGIGGGVDISASPGATFSGLDISGAPGAIFSDASLPAVGDASAGLGALGAGDLAAGGLTAADVAGGGLAAGGEGALAAGFASDAAIAGGAGAGAGIGAGLAAGVGDLASTSAGGALAAGFASDAAIAGGAGAAEGVGAAAAGSSIADFIAPALAALAWIVCTELRRQEKMSSSLYRYGLLHFNSYPEFGKYGYLLWARPLRNYIRRNPSSWVTAATAWVFNKRVNNIAASYGCKHAVWTWEGEAICATTYALSWVLGVVLIPLRRFVPAVANYFSPAHDPSIVVAGGEI